MVKAFIREVGEYKLGSHDTCREVYSLDSTGEGVGRGAVVGFVRD